MIIFTIIGAVSRRFACRRRHFRHDALDAAYFPACRRLDIFSSITLISLLIFEFFFHAAAATTPPRTYLAAFAALSILRR